jgi:hypothetical protein
MWRCAAASIVSGQGAVKVAALGPIKATQVSGVQSSTSSAVECGHFSQTLIMNSTAKCGHN